MHTNNELTLYTIGLCAVPNCDGQPVLPACVDLVVDIVSRRTDEKVHVTLGHCEGDAAHTHLRGTGDDRSGDGLATHARLVDVRVDDGAPLQRLP